MNGAGQLEEHGEPPPPAATVGAGARHHRGNDKHSSGGEGRGRVEGVARPEVGDARLVFIEVNVNDLVVL